jgi:hypothetical protein
VPGAARRSGSTAVRYGVRAVDVARISWDTRYAARRSVRRCSVSSSEKNCNR